MITIITFFEWLFSFLKKFLVFLFTFPGQLLTAIGSMLGTCYVIFSRFTWFDGAVQKVQSATYAVQTVINEIDQSSPVFSALYSFFAVDSFIELGAGFITLTVGVLLVLLTGVFAAVVAALPGLLVARATLKLIRITTGGFVDP